MSGLDEKILDAKLLDRLEKLKLVLDETMKFPSQYLFKFIVPLNQVQNILKVLDGMEIEQKASSNGNYISVSASTIIKDSNEIINIYKKASVIQGVISL
jgi:putative lipoic acid-binding regulatory protein